MPPAIYTQSVIAFIWDFDKTLIHDYMQKPLFDEFKVDSSKFWDEVNGLTEYYGQAGIQVGKDTAYLNHILTYIEHGVFAGLTNKKLRELGKLIEFAPGLPDFFRRTRKLVEDEERYRRHDIKVEHYVVSTGLRQMIEGSSIRALIDDVWACELLPEPPSPGYLDRLELADANAVLKQVGYTIDNTSKTRAIFEINKGVNKQPSVNVNTVVPEAEHRVPIKNMIYVADGPSDVPSFSVVNRQGGKTLGVYAPGDKNYENAALLQEQGRVNSIAEADYSPDSAADRWLQRSLRQIADEICIARDKIFAGYAGAPGHIS